MGEAEIEYFKPIARLSIALDMQIDILRASFVQYIPHNSLLPQKEYHVKLPYFPREQTFPY